MATVYILCDPRDGSIRYVGKTETSVELRLRRHLDKANDPSAQWHTVQWIRSLLSAGIRPEIVPVREVDTEYLDETEIFVIDEYRRLGCDLTNTAKGGTGGDTGNWTFNPETIRKVVEKRRANGTYASPLKGRAQSPEHVAARMEGRDWAEIRRKGQETLSRRIAVARAFGEEYVQRSPAWNKGREMPEHERQHLSDKAKQQWANYSEDEAAEYRAKSAANLTAFRERIASGEIPHPMAGRDPWNKGQKTPPESHAKQWETRRANGFVSQAEMVKMVAERAGESVAKTNRVLKNDGHKVKAEGRAKIWKTYFEMRDEVPDLKVVLAFEGLDYEQDHLKNRYT